MSAQDVIQEISILPSHIADLFTFFVSYEQEDCGNPTYKKIMQNCISLMNLDNEVRVLDNELTSTYPSQLIVPIMQRAPLHNDCDFKKYKPRKFAHTNVKTLMRESSLTKSEKRFPVPVILYAGKYFCRSSTSDRSYLIQQMEQYDQYFSKFENKLDPNIKRVIQPREESYKDAMLLKLYGVNTFIDLSLKNNRENKAEMLERLIYYEGSIVNCLPFPSSDFFSSFKVNGYNGRNIYFNWESEEFEPILSCSKIPSLASVNLYRSWDMLEITQQYLNYVKNILTHKRSSGVVLYCSDGKNQTSLFTSLLRLSLWADEAIHVNLDALQILYFTVAYDWLLFGYDFKQNALEYKHVFVFCFYVLQYITAEIYSVRSPQDFENKLRRKNRLMLVKGLFFSNCKKLNII